MRYSIIIPTYTKYEEAFKECFSSVLDHTDLSDTEIIVVANGSPKQTKYLVEYFSIKYPVKLIWHDEGIGYTKAINEGIKASNGEYIVLLNDDIVLYEQQKNDWIETLNRPFEQDNKVGITGIMKEFCPHANREFLLFFCVMIARKVIDIIGLPDEIFNPGYAEDSDYSCRIEDAGYKVVQVPDDSRVYYDVNKRTGNFPLYHKGNTSFKNWEGGNELIARNQAILRERYNKKSMVNIEKAKQCDGFMGIEELTWLAEQAKNCHGIFLEIGSWHGKSSRAIADNLPEDGKLICVDTWNGSIVEQDTNHASAKGMDGDAACLEFLENMHDHILSGKVLPLRMSSKNAAHGLALHTDIKPKIIFVDAGHEYSEVREDIQHWLPILQEGGTLCGHDYYYHDNIWVGVKKAVDELLPNITIPHNTSIWVYKKEARKPVVIDAFPFNNELEILDIRFETLFDVVDRFILVEAMTTHGGKPKELVFQNNLDRYQKYLHKVTYSVIPEFPVFEGTVTDKSWARERYQRNYIMESLKDCRDDDVIIISDCDEIPNRKAIEECKKTLSGDSMIHGHSINFIASLQMDLYYYNEHTMAKDKWNEAKILTYWKLKELSPCGARYEKYAPIIGNAGRHLSYFGGTDKIIQKLEDTAHQEYNKDVYKNPLRISNAIATRQDLFGRDYVKFESV